MSPADTSNTSETGTASKEVEDKQYSMKIKLENVVSLSLLTKKLSILSIYKRSLFIDVFVLLGMNILLLSNLSK